MKIRFVTLGCKLNFAESSALGKELLSRGHQRASLSDVPDVCVVNTCSVTDTADHKDRQTINQLHRKYPHAIIIVTGCYAQLQPKQVSEIPGVTYVLGQNEKYDIPKLVDALESDAANVAIGRAKPYQETVNEPMSDFVRVANIREVEEFHGVHSADDRTRCFIKVQDGCNYFCTYCTIPYARGKSRNPKISEVVQDAQQALAQGAKELIITGVNIGDFGRSTGETFIDLLRALDSLDNHPTPFDTTLHNPIPSYRVRISSCEPNLLTDEIIEFVARSRHFAPHFHIPLQSGSNEVLKIMKRRYTRELFAERVQHIRQVMPHAFIGVDVIVGTRGETEEYFNQAYEFLKGLDVTQLHVFSYSERPGTQALKIDHVVSADEKHRRSQLLLALSDEKTRAFYASHIGQEAVVLMEKSKAGTPMHGFTDNYVRVELPYDLSLDNQLVRVRLGEFNEDGTALLGRII